MQDPIFAIIYCDYDEEEESAWQVALANLMPSLRLVSPEHPDANKAKVMLTWQPPLGMIRSFANLKAVVSLAQGVDHILKDPDLPETLELVRLVDPYMSEAMAEWALLVILEQHRDAEAYHQAEQRHEWIRIAPRMASQTTVAVMGLGAIGGHVAEKIAMMNFRTLGWSRSPKSIANVATYHGDDGFDACLKEADYIVSLLPLTDATHDLYNARTFAKMKSGAYFINAGRGQQVIEDDLIAAVDSAKLKGAALDVTRIEPLPEDNPLWGHPKIRIWPHVSAQTSPQTAGEQLAAAITAVHAGKTPANRVDIKRGY